MKNGRRWVQYPSPGYDRINPVRSYERTFVLEHVGGISEAGRAGVERERVSSV